MIEITEKAASKVKEILHNENKEGHALRLGIKGGGCSGFTYTLNFDEHNLETDQIFEDKGVKIIIDAKSFVYLHGTELDYVENLTESGFSFSNPNAKRSCGCGSSFQV
jgi:iron-sulfur cluster assembly protein